MQNKTNTLINPQTVSVLLFPRFSNHCLANSIEPLRAANSLSNQELYRWRFLTLDGEPVVSSSGLPVMPHDRLRHDSGGDYLFVMSSYDVTSFANAAMSRALRTAAKRFVAVVGMDTGAWLIAYAGLLENRKATIHWDEFDAFSETFPDVQVIADRYVIDDDRLSCGGAMTSFDLVLHLIRNTHGPALALEVAAYFLYRPNLILDGLRLRHDISPLVEEAIALMSVNLEPPLAIGDIAQRLNVSQRSLGRAFHGDLGAAPKTVYTRLQLAAAKRFAQQSNYSISEIALRCGYASAASMTRAFRAEYGAPPSRFRK